MINITVTPAAYHFDKHEERILREQLITVDRTTLMLPITSTNDVLLTPEGQTAQGFRYSDHAFNQLCLMLAPGLSQLVADLSGQWRKAGADKSLFSSSLALDILNKTIKLRFDRYICGMQFIKNTKEKTIDGIVGQKYRYLSNSDFFDRITGSAQNFAAVFHEACLYGRHLVVRYINKSDKHQYIIADDQYTCGYHFGNSEIGGHAVRAATLLVRAITGDSALCYFTGKLGGRVVHSGRDFEKKLSTLLEVIIRSLPTVQDIEAAGDLLNSKLLKLGGKEHEQRVKYLVQLLSRRHLTQDFASRIVKSTCVFGRENEDAITDQLPAEQQIVLAHRTGYDLFVSLIREARNLAINQRETAEQVAYTLLTNKNWLSD